MTVYVYARSSEHAVERASVGASHHSEAEARAVQKHLRIFMPNKPDFKHVYRCTEDGKCEELEPTVVRLNGRLV